MELAAQLGRRDRNARFFAGAANDNEPRDDKSRRVRSLTRLWFGKDTQQRSSGLFVSPLGEANALAGAIVVDEFDPGGLQGEAHRGVVGRRHRGFLVSELGPSDGGHPHGRRTGQVHGGPAQQRPRGADLARGKGSTGAFHVDNRDTV